MTDRELLEKAAKAAGIACWYQAGLQYFGPRKRTIIWNPLTDDGDVFRLAVKLKIDFTAVGHLADGTECCSVIFSLAGDYETISEPIVSDPYAASRRAIVRAAAAIGEKQ